MTIVFRRAVALVITTCVLLTALVASAEAATKLGPVTGIKIVPTASTATISWTKAPGATSYRVCLQEFIGQYPCAQFSGQSSATKVSFKGLTPNPGGDYIATVYSYGGGKHVAAKPRSFNLLTPPAPSAPTGLKPTSTATTVTVSWTAATGAQDYDVCLTTNGTTSTCAQRSPRSTARSVTFGGLVPTDGTDYYVRVFAHNAYGSTASALLAVDLPVAAVTNVKVVRETGTSRLLADWSTATNAEQYEFQTAGVSAMTTGLKTYTVSTPSATTASLPLGANYFYRVRGINGAAKGAWTAVTMGRIVSDPTDVAVLTYNLCGQDKCVNSTNRMWNWRKRKPYAGAIARGARAGIIATQESHDKETQFGTELPGYTLAAYYSAKSLYFDKAKYKKLRSGVITLSSADRKYAVWATLQDLTTQTMFIVVDAHLQPYKGRSSDVKREAQSKKLISSVTSINPYKLPVVYAGDFNSNKSNADQGDYPGGYDAPRKVFLAAGIPDTFDVAPSKINPTWNSANQAKNPPLKHSDHVDHVFVDPRIEVLQFKVVISIKDGLYATPFATDHNPVRVALTIPGR